MTVAELIAQLQALDPNATVFVTTPEGNDKYVVAEVGSLADGSVIVTVEK
jgi:hypothetical protein